MNISALVNPVSEGLPRRSSSNSQIIPPSPATSVAKLPTPPATTPKAMPRKRKLRDPKPIWAYREGETLEGEAREQYEQQQQARPSPPPPPTPWQPNHPPSAQPPSYNQGHGGPQSSNQFQPPPAADELHGFERPVSDDPYVYNELVRKLGEFIMNTVVDNNDIRYALEESRHTQVEIEARWGQIENKMTNQRLAGVHETECILKATETHNFRFRSTMTLDQHKRTNGFLNSQVQQSKVPGVQRPNIDYKHVKEIDVFYDLDVPSLEILPAQTRKVLIDSLSHGASSIRLRVTRDAKTNAVLRKVIKSRVANLEISSPQTEWDYRIGVNLEINYPGDFENLSPTVEPGRSSGSTARSKDRISYSWLGAYQIDLTQVIQEHGKNHELELELEPTILLEAGDRALQGDDRDFEKLMTGMLNNLRALSREITGPPGGA
ncbi:CYTH-like domain-containing protein [Massariosphaeria phaeospora]|uniref:mRNA-capping enzyme subunit beta n=1 Tax=Massariosphaeria phaeospora TaxID=100035 RepID=A0A7C8I136_9PLEO|nr:CYTH-like domain-containing protein [Massariosphaeria phaeospora]